MMERMARSLCFLPIICPNLWRALARARSAMRREHSLILIHQAARCRRKDIMNVQNHIPSRSRLTLPFGRSADRETGGFARPATLSGMELKKIVAEMLG